MSLKKNMLSAAIVPLVVVFLAHPGNPLLFNISQFDPGSTAVLYGGDAHPDDGAVDMTDQNQSWRVGHVTFNERVRLWDSSSGGLYDFTTHFAFTIDVGSRVYYGSGFAFFMAPEGFQIPLNSTGGFLGLYNTTFSNTSRKQIIHVEFDTYPSSKWDPEYEHVGINQNSIASSIMVPWDVKYHSGDTIDVTISYDASTMNLTVSWSFKTTPNPNESTSLMYPVDLRTVLPEWVTIGFSATTGSYIERHTLHSWDFSSNLVVKDTSSQKPNNGSQEPNNGSHESNTGSQKSKWKKIATGVSASIVFLLLVLIGAFELRSNRRRKTRMKEKAAEATNSTSINKDLERGAGPRSYTYKDLASATNNFSSEQKLGEGGFGPVYKGYLLDLDIPIATGRRATDRTIKNTSSMMPGLVAWVWGLHGSGNILTAADEKMTSDSDKIQVKRLLLVGLRCAHPDQSQRPSIRQAIRFLNFEADLPDLPNEMPVAVYHVPTPLVCSSRPSSISIITEGR
ncbi:hypothetical protein MLD38_037679 [Melastoma candidum]|uniref:Uncharacterized protein n=1 Tax=Melastoma candidum TaxID=119954 RepID=A0ACB9LP58_9MYRT|nr:hypothetical protein MLD38_037679 [Melastoma candidum]